MSQTLLDIKNEIIDYVSQGKYFKPSKLLGKTFQNIDQAKINEFGDILVEIIKKDPDLFTTKIYEGLMFFSRNSHQDKFYELDKYILDKYGLIEGENVIDFFYGRVIDNYSKISGRIFLTNLRLIASGDLTRLSKGGSGSKSLVGTVRLIKKGLISLAIGNAIRKALNKDIGEVGILPYGYHYPVYNAYKIKRTKSAIIYNTNIEYERKGKSKTEKLFISVGPSKKLKDLSRKNEILDNIENLLTQNQ